MIDPINEAGNETEARCLFILYAPGAEVHRSGQISAKNDEDGGKESEKD